VSDVSRITDDMSRLYTSDRRGRQTNKPREKYYYENTRRPDPNRSPRYVDDSDRESEYRRRAMARALSESPSREKGLQMMRSDSPDLGRRRRPRRPSDYSPPDERDNIRFGGRSSGSRRQDGRVRVSDGQNSYGREVPTVTRSPRSSAAQYPDQRGLPDRQRTTELPNDKQRRVVIDSNGERKVANVLKEGRDSQGRWIEVEETVVRDDGRREQRRQR